NVRRTVPTVSRSPARNRSSITGGFWKRKTSSSGSRHSLLCGTLPTLSVKPPRSSGITRAGVAVAPPEQDEQVELHAEMLNLARQNYELALDLRTVARKLKEG